MDGRKPHTDAVSQALLVTFLWSTSFVIIKLGYRSHIPPLSFAGLRYGVAFLGLLAAVCHSEASRRALGSLSPRDCRRLLAFGLVYISLAQGLQFMALAGMPAAAVSLILNLTPVIVGLLASRSLGEQTSWTQWIGIGLTVFGALAYFVPCTGIEIGWLGLTSAVGALAANAAGSLMGRWINRETQLPPVVVTTASMGFGSVPLLLVGGAFQGFGGIGPRDCILIAWLALVNTALAFTLWNRSLKVLSAVESSVINSTMLPQIALLSWVMLGESLDARKLAALAIATTGIILVQHQSAASPKRKY